MKCKKMLSALLACSMVAAMSASAFAADMDVTSTTAQDISLPGGFISVPIKVTITDPSANKVVLNPYGLKVKLDSGEYAYDASGDITDKIISAPIYIKNETPSNVNVNVVATGTLGTNSKAKFATADITTPTGKAKSVFMYVDMQTSDGSTAKAANVYSKTSTSQLVIAAAVTGKEPTAKTLYTMGAGDATATNAQARVAGSIDATDADPWGPDDAITVNLKFSFVPTMTTPTAG